MAKLTVKEVERAKPGRHGDGQGLYLIVADTGGKSWVLRVQSGGRRRDIGIGSASSFTLAEARERAAILRKVAKRGGDAIAERDKEKVQIPTFEKAAEACHKEKAAGWAKRHADAFLSTLKLHAYPQLGKRLVDSIDERDIVSALSPLWTDRPAAARKVRQRIALVLDFAKGHGWRGTGAPRESLRPMLAKQARPGNFAAMPYDDVPAFVTELRSKPATMSRLALLFTILTGARSGETRTAKWSHIDFDRRLWNRPAKLMKGGVAHSVTLSKSTIALLRQAEKQRTTLADCLIFPGNGGTSLADMSLLKLVKAYETDASVHGFRSSFRTWAAEKMPTIPQPVAEAALAHLVQDKVERAYQRAKFIEMRRELLEGWGDYCDGREHVLRLVG